MTVTVRDARPADHAAIDAVVGAAFGSPVEVTLVHRLHDSGLVLWERVAVDEGDVVGHVIISRAHLDGGQAVAMLSPLAVRPDRQAGGIGSALVREVCSLADAAGEPVVVLQGSPRYYPRFGFVDGRTLGITMDLPDWAPREAGQALTLSAYDPSVRGHVVEPEAFAGLG